MRGYVQEAIRKALLENRGRLLTAHELAGLVWADDPEGGPINADVIIRVAIHTMRHEKGERILNERGYRLA